MDSSSHYLATLSWVWDNRQWLFSGIGVAALTSLFAYWRSKRRLRQASVIDPEDDEMYIPLATEPDFPPSLLWSVAEKIPGLSKLAVRRRFTEQEIAKRVRVTVSGDGDGMSFWKFENQGKFNVRLDFVNFNPFPVIADRITGSATVGGMPVAQLSVVDRHEIPAISHKIVPIEVELSTAQLGQIELQLKQRADPPAGMGLKVYLETPVRSATLQRQLATGNCRFLNFH